MSKNPGTNSTYVEIWREHRAPPGKTLPPDLNGPFPPGKKCNFEKIPKFPACSPRILSRREKKCNFEKIPRFSCLFSMILSRQEKKCNFEKIPKFPARSPRILSRREKKCNFEKIPKFPARSPRILSRREKKCNFEKIPRITFPLICDDTNNPQLTVRAQKINKLSGVCLCCPHSFSH